MLRFKKIGDPLSQRSRELTAKIAELESRIKKLHAKITPDNRPRFRSTAFPHGGSIATALPGSEPVFERVDQNQLNEAPEPRPAPSHWNEPGAPRRDLAALYERLKKYFSSSAAANPKLVNYLAAGNVQGLRPLRYEKRVARNRFLALTIVFVGVLFGIFYFLARRH
jgi:hypothetical protein